MKIEVKKKRTRWQEIILVISSILLLIAGLTLVSGPWIKSALISNYSYDYTRETITSSKMQENQSTLGEFDYAAVVPPSLVDVLAAMNTDYSDQVIGQLTIKSLSMNLPILKGTTNDNLLIGAGTMQENQVMGMGNYTLIGHHMQDKSLLFGPLLKIKEGAIIQLNDQEILYTYQVQTTKIVSETDMSVLADVGDNRLTLITCDVSSATNQRFVVVATLVEKNNLNQKNVNTHEPKNNTEIMSKNVQEYQEVVSLTQKHEKRSISVILIGILILLFLGCLLFFIRKHYRQLEH